MGATLNRIILGITLCVALASAQHRKEYEGRELTEDQITCSFDLLTHAVYQNNLIDHEEPEKQSKPLIVSFTALDSKTPSIRYMDVVAVAGESKAISVGDAEKLVLIDVSSGSKNVDVFAIYRHLGVAVWTRNYHNTLVAALGLPHVPTGRVGIGRCQ